ncbi:MAG TPA: hypothetical protein VGR72_11950 [Candidatus Acidoferrales bacterium]|nr:hypothetical protein [Candidatus Acidoferrales bacterium]
MELTTKIQTIILLAATLALSSCSGVISLPVPAVTSLNPSSVVAGSVQFTLHVIGSGFAPNSQILVDGASRFVDSTPVRTIFLSQTELTAIIPPGEVSQPGAISIAVFTSAPGGGISVVQTLTVTPSTAPVPQILSIFPSSVLAGSNSATVTVNGANFVNTSVANVNGSNRPTVFQSGIKLLVSLASTDIDIAGTVQVAILNPPVPGGNPPGGGLSNAMPVNVVNPSPTVRSLIPGSVVAGTTNSTLGVLGTGMDSASQVFVNGSARPTSAVSPTQVFSQLASQDVATAGTFPVQVVNPPPGGGVSSTLLFSVVPSSKGVGLPELVDFSNNGTQADDGVSNPSGPTMDSSGRFIAYASPATNLLLTINQDPTTNPDTNGVPDIFLFDSCLGTTSSCIPRTRLIDSGPNGVIANGAGSDPAMNSTGLELAFISFATNLVPSVTFNGTTPQVFVASTCAGAPFGCIPVVSLVSIASDGVSPANDASSQVAISADGRFVAFVSTATNLVAGATTGTPEIYLRDTCLRAGGTCAPSTTLISASSSGAPADGPSGQPSVASGAFGQVVTFASTATNIAGNMTGVQQVYAMTLCIGAGTGCTPNTGQLVSTPDGTAFANGTSIEPNINANGRFIAFASAATNLPGAPATPMQEIYLRDLCTGQGSVCTPATSLVSVASNGTSPANGLCESPNMGNTAQFVAFSSLASNLVATSTSGEQVYVRNTCNGFSTGCTASTALVSVSSTGLSGNGQSLNPVLTGTGHEVAFFSAASNLVNNDLNGFPDVFLTITTF